MTTQDTTTTFGKYEAMKCQDCPMWIDARRIVYPTMTYDHYMEVHPDKITPDQMPTEMDGDPIGVPYSPWNETEITVPDTEVW